ncbi:MAG: DUF3352 domain-containing protein [Chloroflexia bacterium]|nr:DUF3352 domain-containing protein [Chloroflexia bacterium]
MDLMKPMKRACCRPLVALALSAGIAAPLFMPGPLTAQETLPDIAAAAPESAVLFHSTDLDRDGAQWQQTEELLARVGVPDALDLWEEAVLAEGGESGDVTQADLDALLGGELAIVVLPTAVELFTAMAMQGMESDTDFQAADATPIVGAGEPIGVVAILRPGDAATAWEYVERQVADLAAQQNVTVEESVYGDAELLVVPPADDATPSGTDAENTTDEMDEWMSGLGMDGSGSFVAASSGDYIVAGMTEADVTGVVDVIDGNAGSLADSPAAQAVAAALPADALSFTYIDGARILETLDPEVIAMAQSALMDVPIESLASQAGIAVSADVPGFRFDTITILNETADLDAIIVQNDPSVAAAAERAPAGTFLFQAGRLPETTFQGHPYALAQAVNTSVNDGPGDEPPMMTFPTEEEMEAEIAAAAAILEFDPGADLFDLLGDEFIAFSTFPSVTFESFEIDAVAAISTTDPDALTETARKIAAAIERTESTTDVATRSVGEETVSVITDSQSEGFPGIEFGVVADQAVVGIGGGIEALTTSPTDSLAADAQYQTVMDLLPGDFYQVGYVDIGQAIDPLMMLIGTMGMMGDADDASQATPTSATGDPRNIRALGAVAFQEDNVMGASAILYIAGGG